MSLLTRIGVRAAGRLARTRVGEAVVVHPAADGVTADARLLAETLPVDPEHAVVVADVPPTAPFETWKAFLAALPKGRGPLRVVPGREPREIAPQVWQWLADQTGRAVLAPYGVVNHLAGRLFVHSVDQTGWVSFRRDAGPVWKGKRFPQVPWDTVEFGRVRAAGYRGVAEPLPAGLWLRPDVDDDVLATARARLYRTLPCLPDSPTIVLGVPNAAPVDLPDLTTFLRTLPPATTAAARLVTYGDVTVPDGVPLGQAVADAVDAEVCCYTGIPSGTPNALDVLTLRTDGSLGWSTFAQALAYRPHGATRLARHRPPTTGLTEIAPGVYWLAQDVVLEVVPAGLWIRRADQTADPSGARTAPIDPMHNLLLYEATDPANADHLRDLAETLVTRIDDATRPSTRLMPSTALSSTALTPRPTDVPTATEPTTQALRPPTPTTPASVPEPPEEVLPVSPPPVSVLPPPAPTQVHIPDSTDPLAEDDSDLPWLSRLMETMAIPVPARPSKVEDPNAR